MSTPTKPKVPAPPKKTSAASAGYASRLGSDITMESSPNNMRSENLMPLNFRVSPEVRRRYKMAAAASGKHMREILEESFELWMQKHSPKE